MSETKRLGRGLEALLGPVTREQAEASGALRELPMASVRPNPFQPRTRMDEAAARRAGRVDRRRRDCCSRSWCGRGTAATS